MKQNVWQNSFQEHSGAGHVQERHAEGVVGGEADGDGAGGGGGGVSAVAGACNHHGFILHGRQVRLLSVQETEDHALADVDGAVGLRDGNSVPMAEKPPQPTASSSHRASDTYTQQQGCKHTTHKLNQVTNLISHTQTDKLT